MHSLCPLLYACRLFCMPAVSSADGKQMEANTFSSCRALHGDHIGNALDPVPGLGVGCHALFCPMHRSDIVTPYVCIP